MASRRLDSPWDVLEIAPTKDLDRIRHAYLRQVRLHHPDRFGMDPDRFRLQEDQMCIINLAYQEALAAAESGASATRAQRAAQDPSRIHCVEHGQLATQRCTQCASGICALCPGRLRGLCNRHLAQLVFHRCRRRAAREWIPFLALIFGGSWVGLSPAWSIAAIMTYAFGLGLFRIRFSRWRGLIYLWIFPVGLMASGLYSLYQSLDHLNRASHDESLWAQFLSQGPESF